MSAPGSGAGDAGEVGAVPAVAAFDVVDAAFESGSPFDLLAGSWPDYESHATALDRTELGALLVAAGLSTAQEHALISLLALNGLRISEALGADITAMDSERGHRTLTVVRVSGSGVPSPPAASTPSVRPGTRVARPATIRARRRVTPRG